jgi:hypothetical protein
VIKNQRYMGVVMESRSPTALTKEWERTCSLMASFPGYHSSTWVDAMMASIARGERERNPC